MYRALSILLVSLFLSFTVQAQSKEEKAVADAVENLRTAIIDADEAALNNITADELTYGHSSGNLEDKAKFVGALASGKSDFKTMDLTNQTVTVVGKTALVRHELTGSVVDNGNAADIHLGVLLVWQKQGSQWKLLARQAYKL
ncbi:MAG: nuclear transport factor 2 family protein [Cyclobacteriaceae bacterium]